MAGRKQRKSRLEEISEQIIAKADTAEILTTHYPTHDFVIDIRQAKQLFRSVDEPRYTLLVLASLPEIQMLYAMDGPPTVLPLHRKAIPQPNGADSNISAAHCRQANDDIPSADTSAAIGSKAA